jgi:predicted alpha/beta-fold hydrolase
VRRPLLALSARDDPLIPEDALPSKSACANPAVTLEIYPAGGHIAFVSGAPWRPAYWAEGRALAFLAEAAGL